MRTSFIEANSGGTAQFSHPSEHLKLNKTENHLKNIEKVIVQLCVTLSFGQRIQDLLVAVSLLQERVLVELLNYVPSP